MKLYKLTFLFLGVLAGCSRQDVDHTKRQLHEVGQEAKQTAHKAAEELKKAELAKIPGSHFASKLPFHSAVMKSFSNYPLTEERIQRLQSEISAFLPNRKDYILDTDEFQEVKARLLAAQTPVLRHHSGDEDNKGPVLRRTTVDSDDNSSVQPLRSFAILP